VFVWGVVLVLCVCVSLSGVLFSVGVCVRDLLIFLQENTTPDLTRVLLRRRYVSGYSLSFTHPVSGEALPLFEDMPASATMFRIVVKANLTADLALDLLKAFREASRETTGLCVCVCVCFVSLISYNSHNSRAQSRETVPAPRR